MEAPWASQSRSTSLKDQQHEDVGHNAVYISVVGKCRLMSL
jgi:hypothetical protein